MRPLSLLPPQRAQWSARTSSAVAKRIRVVDTSIPAAVLACLRSRLMFRCKGCYVPSSQGSGPVAEPGVRRQLRIAFDCTGFMDFRTLCRMESVCKSWRSILSEPAPARFRLSNPPVSFLPRVALLAGQNTDPPRRRYPPDVVYQQPFGGFPERYRECSEVGALTNTREGRSGWC